MSLSTVPVAPGRLPLLGHALFFLRRSRLDYLQSLRDLGEAVQIYLGPKSCYVLNSPELIHRMLVVQADDFAKGLLFDRTRPYFGNGILTSSGNFHLRQRRLIQPAFHPDNIARYTAVMSDVASRWVGSWKSGQIVAVEREMHEIATGIITRGLFATEDGANLAALVEDSLPRFIAGVGRRTLLPAASLADLLPGKRRFNRIGEQLRSATQRLIATHQADGRDHGDLVSMLSAARDGTTGAQMSEMEMTDEVITLLIAGIETVATTLTWACYELGRRTELRERLHREVDEVLGGRPASAEDIPKLRFTGAFLNEILRVHQPIWLLMRRAMEPVDLGSVHIPAGTEVIYSPTTLHRDPQLYPDPLRIDPDRWLAGHTDTSNRFSFAPFGVGRRKCIGESFAWNEMHVTLSTIAAQWRLDLLPKKKIKTIVDAVVHIRHLPMIVLPRGNENRRSSGYQSS